MPLHRFIEKKKITLNGVEVTFKNDIIKYSPTTIHSHVPDEGTVYTIVSIFKYEVESPFQPTLFTNQRGEKFIVPQRIKVHPKTELTDIIWTKPEVKVRVKSETHTVVTDSGATYKTKYNPETKEWKCNCFGYYRLKDRSQGCKHIKLKRQELSK